MFRSLLAASLLALSAPAFACGGQDCGANCAMKKAGDFAAVDQAEGTKFAFSIDGGICGGTAASIKDTIGKIEGVNAVAVSHETSEAKVAFDAKKTNEDAIRKAVTEAGYSIKPSV